MASYLDRRGAEDLLAASSFNDRNDDQFLLIANKRQATSNNQQQDSDFKRVVIYIHSFGSTAVCVCMYVLVYIQLCSLLVACRKRKERGETHVLHIPVYAKK